jgi:hypothetical protein
MSDMSEVWEGISAVNTMKLPSAAGTGNDFYVGAAIGHHARGGGVRDFCHLQVGREEIYPVLFCTSPSVTSDGNSYFT